jgi:AraC-like DNA-binding protein
LSTYGEDLKLHIETTGEPAISAYQSQLETLVVTVARIRDAVGGVWSPVEVSLAHRARENLPEIDVLAGSRVLTGTGQTYLTIPRALLGSRFERSNRFSGGDGGSPFAEPLPDDFGGLVRHQVACFISDPSLRVDTVAESLQMSRRVLQRGLESQGLTYSLIVSETRTRQASRWLEQTDKPIAEIAFDLGYSDPSNFTRAFRRRTGLSPQAFRDVARGGNGPLCDSMLANSCWSRLPGAQ